MKENTVTHGDNATVAGAVRERILQALHGIRFGAVEIIIHDGKVVQIGSEFGLGRK